MYTYSCFVLNIILFYFCNGIFGAHIFMHVYKNKSGVLYDESPTIYYEEEEAVKLTCNIDGSTVKDGILPTLKWIEGGEEWTPPNNGVSIVITKIMKNEDDGSQIKCKARSKVLDKDWSISVYFERKKTAKERLANSNLFKLFLIGIGGVLGAAISLIIIYRLFLCCRKTRHDNVPLDNKKEEADIYSDIDRNTKNKSSNNLTEIGFDNIVCVKENETYISFESPESDQYFDSDNTTTLKIQNCQNDSQEIKITDEKKVMKNDKISLGITEEASEC